MVLHSMETRLLASIRRVFKTTPPKVAIALSGGLDSMCLTHMLHKVNKNQKLGIEIHTVSMDHGLRPESSQELNFIGEQVKKLGLYDNFHPEKLDMSKLEPNDAFEEFARMKRYERLHELCSKNDIKFVLTGHHFNDNLETFLMRLLVNSGVFGLRGINEKSVAPFLTPPFQSLHKINLIRPLLGFTKNELYQYAKENDIEWVEDHTNELEITKRNIVRLYLRQNPKTKANLIQLHQQVIEFTNDVEQQVNRIYKSMKQMGNFGLEPKYFQIILDNTILENNSDLVIGRLLFKILYPYSPSQNYHYSFHKLIRVVPKIRNGETFTLLQLKWITKKDGHKTKIMIRRQNAELPMVCDITVEPKSETQWILFDNTYWFKFINTSDSTRQLRLKNLQIKDSLAKNYINNEPISHYEGVPFIYNLDNKKDSYFPTHKPRKDTQWKLKHNIYEFE